MAERKIYATFFGDAKHPVEWKNDFEKDLMWFYDDLHCPNPISPMYFSVGGWWGPTCKYFYKRFGVGGSDWIAKRIGCYVYTAVVPPTTDEDKVAAMYDYYGAVIPYYAQNFMDLWDNEYVPGVILDGPDEIGRQAVEVREIVQQIRHIPDRVFGRNQIGYGLGIVIAARHLVFHPGACLPGIVHRKGLYIAFDA